MKIHKSFIETIIYSVHTGNEVKTNNFFYTTQNSIHYALKKNTHPSRLLNNTKLLKIRRIIKRR